MLNKKNSFRNKQVSFIKDESNEPTYDQTNEAKVNLFLFQNGLSFFSLDDKFIKLSHLLFTSNSRANQIEIIRYFITIISEISHETILDLISSEIFNEITSLLLPVNIDLGWEIIFFFSKLSIICDESIKLTSQIIASKMIPFLDIVSSKKFEGIIYYFKNIPVYSVNKEILKIIIRFLKHISINLGSSYKNDLCQMIYLLSKKPKVFRQS